MHEFSLRYLFHIWYVFTIISIIFAVVSENRSPIRTLARILLLVFLPFLGAICYYIFGREDWKSKKISREYKKKAKNIPSELSLPSHISDIRPDFLSLATLLDETWGSPLFKGSNVEVIIKGEIKLQQLLKDIENAQKHIHMQYFIFRNDESGTKIKNALMKKAKEGVEVRFLYDNVGSFPVPARFYNEMKSVGVKVYPFLKERFVLKSKFNYRNHRKIVIIDGGIWYVGGMNIWNEYLCKGKWRDTHMRITGPGIYGLQSIFLLDWFTSGEKDISDLSNYFLPREVLGNNLLQTVPGGPNLDQKNLMLATMRIANNAKQYLYIQTPYFLPPQSLLDSLKIAGLWGVDVRIMVSSKSDSWYVDPAVHSYFTELLDAGIKIYKHTSCFVHAKTLVSDDYLSVIGSANMDFRSLEHHFEINCYLYDTILAEKNKHIFLQDLKQCEEITLEKREKRSRGKKFLESIMRLFAPLM